MIQEYERLKEDLERRISNLPYAEQGLARTALALWHAEQDVVGSRSVFLAELRNAAEEGASTQRISELTGLSPEGVQELLDSGSAADTIFTPARQLRID